ncbi:Gfo/Idh/MocA family oxidoreductase [Sporosarcina sp. FSL K6-1522]|uniref:Gfo/Idh/MocA family protein n=1 Tax=Sporosarcina sp. FSL K6-1522 TaxID=2921554 RepID=UPI003159C836
MDRPIQWGILGAANIARQQMIPAILQSTNGAVQAIASKSGKAQAFADEFTIPTVLTDYQALLQLEEIDAVYIALPNSLHKEWIDKAIAAGKHVLCEKPIVLEVHELAEIFTAANQKKVHVMEAFMYRFHPQMIEARKLLEAGVIGEPLTIRSRFHFTMGDWQQDIRMQSELGGGVLWDIGGYCLNVMLDLIGEEPAAIHVLQGRKQQVDTHIAFQLRFSNDVLGIADCSFYGPMTNDVDIIGTKGTMHLPHAFRPDLNEDVGVVRIHTEEGPQQFEWAGNSYVAQVNAFQEAILANVPLAYTPQQMLQQSRMLQKLVEQLKTS